MVLKEDIIRAAEEAGFEDIGFTTAEPFEEHAKLLASMKEEYAWAEGAGLDLYNGTDPKTILPGAKTIIVLMETYSRKAFPRAMEGRFGRCYLDDDRVTKDGLYLRIRQFRGFLRDHGIDSRVPFNLPHRVAAARAGMGGFGKNSLGSGSHRNSKSFSANPINAVVVWYDPYKANNPDSNTIRTPPHLS